MDDILIIILTLLFTVLAAINQSKKKKAGQVEKESLPWDEIFGEGRRELVPAEEVPAEHATFPPRPARKKVNIPKNSDRTFPGEGTRNEIIMAVTEQKKISSTEELDTASYWEDFSLKKAVIFSEVLRPKYLE